MTKGKSKVIKPKVGASTVSAAAPEPIIVAQLLINARDFIAGCQPFLANAGSAHLYNKAELIIRDINGVLGEKSN